MTNSLPTTAQQSQLEEHSLRGEAHQQHESRDGEEYDFEATYSPEDNKLRLYAQARLDDDLYQRVKENGFKWAPKQELFVAPKWTPAREDFCIELAGEITGEGTTLAERAEAKADRLEALSRKRAGEAVGYHAAAERISQRFAGGQPILVGHHSEKRARKDKERMDSATRKAIDAQSAFQYWSYRVKGVEQHANRKNRPDVVARRIKKLLSDLRAMQRSVNHAAFCLGLWRRIEAIADLEKQCSEALHWSGAGLSSGSAAPWRNGSSLWYMLDRGEITSQECIEICIQHWERVGESNYYQRFIAHILNRLAYEQGELGEVSRFEGEITPVILQGFARTHGANKPKATATDLGFFLISDVDLPAHIGDGTQVELAADQWRDLMQSVGYVVEVKARKKARAATTPLINPTLSEAKALQSLWNAKAGESRSSEVVEMTQQQYSARSGGDYSICNTVVLDAQGINSTRLRNPAFTPSCRVRAMGSGKLFGALRVVCITDKPAKPLPLDLQALASCEVASNG